MDDFKQSYTVAPAPQRLVPYSRRWYLAKLILRSLCAVFGAVVIGLTNKLKSNEDYYSRHFVWRTTSPRESASCCTTSSSSASSPSGTTSDAVFTPASA